MRDLIFQGVVLTLAAGAAYLVYKRLTETDEDKMGCLESKPEAPAQEPAVKKTKVEAAAPATSNSTAKPAAAAAKPAAKKKEKEKEEFSWNKKKPDPKDFMFSNLKNQELTLARRLFGDAVCIKPPGSINGQMFIIEDCENCDIYVCDYMAQVQVDYCKNCRIFVGPTESSIFIRNCEGCKCIIACQQYRARECVDCDTLLFSSTAPVVEESRNMRFGCFRFFYFNLAQQFESVKMSVYDNKWSEIYDFTPKEGNWSFLPIDTKASDLVKPLSEVGADFCTKEEEAQHSDTSVVPFTAGYRKKEFEGQERAFILLMPGKHAEGPQLFSKMGDTITVIQTKQMKLDSGKAQTLFPSPSDAALHGAVTQGMVVGVEVAGAGALAAAAEAAKTVGADVAYVSESADKAKAENTTFFETWRDFAGASLTH